MKLQIIKEERSTIGTKVRALAKELSTIEHSGVFESNFKNRLIKLKTGNHTQADLLYRVWHDEQHGIVEIFHRCNTKSDVLVMRLFKD